MKNTTFILLLSFVLASCQEKQHQKGPGDLAVQYVPLKVSANADAAKGETREKATDVVLQAPPPAAGTNIIDTAKKITMEGDIRFQTADVNKTRKAIISEVKKAGGYIAEDIQSKDENLDQKEYVLKVLVPAKNFDFLVDTVSASADKIDSKNISIKDVTTQYIDMKTRLENKHKLEQTYLGLLKQAKRMSEVLEIEDKITEIHSDIESSQGELNYLVKQVAYSSLDITFYTKTAAAYSGNSFGDKLASAIAGGWEALQVLFFCLINIWPFIIIVGVLCVIFVRRHRKRQAAA